MTAIQWTQRQFSQYGQAWCIFFASSLLILFSAFIAPELLVTDPNRGPRFGCDNWFTNWDGQWYCTIAKEGYGFSERWRIIPSYVFFPLYPLLGWFINQVSEIRMDYCLWLVSLLSCFGLATIWQRAIAAHPVPQPSDTPLISLTLLMFWPTAYFMRIGYTESLYLLLVTLWLWCLYTHASLRWIIAIAGLVTATRPTGISCAIVTAVYAWRRFNHLDPIPRLLSALCIGAVSCWGLGLFMLHLQFVHGDGLLFATSQFVWNHGQPRDIFIIMIEEMLTFQRIWLDDIHGIASLYNMPYLIQNKILWVVTVGLTFFGILRKWLTLEEALYSLISLGLFYLYKGPHNMEAVGRYSLSIIPAYLVLARIVSGLPPAVLYSLIAIIASIMFLHAGLFSQLHIIF